MAHTIPKDDYFLNFFLFVIFFIVLYVAERVTSQSGACTSPPDPQAGGWCSRSDPGRATSGSRRPHLDSP